MKKRRRCRKSHRPGTYPCFEENRYMTNQSNTPAKRVFKYGQQTFPDPGAEYSTEQVLNHLRTFFPELGHARVDEKTLADGTLEITFSKQVTRKG
jgi:PRTRC genetic system protein C